MNQISWGIIGCGDVTEVKSGPAFNKVTNSSLLAVMRRDAAKAKDYAERHQVPKWYNDAYELISDRDVNAVYVATPPSSHEEYAVAALRAGKPVYLEKPMTTDAASAGRISDVVREVNGKLSVAHYRRGQPLFKKIRSLIREKAIGDVRFARLSLYKKALTENDLKLEKTSWRVDPSIAGGGLFHDLAPHQLDILYFLFGKAKQASGIATNQAGLYRADDMVTGNILYENGVQFTGAWCFNVPEAEQLDFCEIMGSNGKIGFSFFEQQPVWLTVNGKTEIFSFDPLPHVQQPMIEEVARYFLGTGPNPCSAEEGVEVMHLIDTFTKK